MLVLDKPHPPHHTNVDKFSAVQSFCLLFKGIEWCHTHYIVYVYVYTVLKNQCRYTHIRSGVRKFTDFTQYKFLCTYNTRRMLNIVGEPSVYLEVCTTLQ